MLELTELREACLVLLQHRQGEIPLKGSPSTKQDWILQ